MTGSLASAVGLIEDGVIVIRTFSKTFGLAAARVGYALAGRDVAAELNKRQHPAPVSTLSGALAGLAAPPNVSSILEERGRMAERLRELGFEPLPSHASAERTTRRSTTDPRRPRQMPGLGAGMRSTVAAAARR